MCNQQNRPLGWTTIEEGKKLVEAGLSPETADMWYDLLDVCYCHIPKVNEFQLHDFYYLDREYPCWSLGRLIDLFPSDNNGEHVEVARVMKSKYFLSHWSLYFIDPKDHRLNSVKEPVLIDGVVKIVLLCLEHGIIQKGGKK